MNPYELHKKISEIELSRRIALVEIIGSLREMKDTGAYKEYLGDQEASFAAYLGETDIFLSRAQVERWFFIQDKLCKPFHINLIELTDVPESRLEDIARYAKSASEAQDLIFSAKTLIGQDWTYTINNLKGKPAPEVCEHKKEEAFLVCIDCGKKHKVHEANS